MRATVFTDKALVKQAGRFVWLAIDTENAQNAAFMEKFPTEGVPTFLVLDPSTEKVVYTWLGSVDRAQLETRLDAAEAAFKPAAPAAGEGVLARAERANGTGQFAAAVPLYQQALAAGIPDAERPRVVEAYINAVTMLPDSQQRCAEIALAELPRLPKVPATANVAAIGLTCALSAPDTAAWRPAAIKDLEQKTREGLSIEGGLADDRCAAFSALVSAREEQHDAAGAKQVAAEWLTFLEHEAAAAPSPDARAALDGFRVVASLKAEQPERGIAALEASERDLPMDYNPPARLARLYSEVKRYEDAERAVGRALELAYGPRKVSIYDLKATIEGKQGRKDDAKATLTEALQYAKQLPAAQHRDALVKRIQEKIEKL